MNRRDRRRRRLTLAIPAAVIDEDQDISARCLFWVITGWLLTVAALFGLAWKLISRL